MQENTLLLRGRRRKKKLNVRCWIKKRVEEELVECNLLCVCKCNAKKWMTTTMTAFLCVNGARVAIKVIRRCWDAKDKAVGAGLAALLVRLFSRHMRTTR